MFPTVFDIFNYLLGTQRMLDQCLISSNFFLNKHIYFISYIVTPRPERVYGTCNRRGVYVHQKTFLII